MPRVNRHSGIYRIGMLVQINWRRRSRGNMKEMRRCQSYLSFLVPLSGGGVFAIAVVLWAEGPADVASAGAILSLPRPPGQLIVPQQLGRVWCRTAHCQVKGSPAYMTTLQFICPKLGAWIQLYLHLLEYYRMCFFSVFQLHNYWPVFLNNSFDHTFDFGFCSYVL